MSQVLSSAKQDLFSNIYCVVSIFSSISDCKFSNKFCSYNQLYIVYHKCKRFILWNLSMHLLERFMHEMNSTDIAIYRVIYTYLYCTFENIRNKTFVSDEYLDKNFCVSGLFFVFASVKIFKF